MGALYFLHGIDSVCTVLEEALDAEEVTTVADAIHIFFKTVFLAQLALDIEYSVLSDDICKGSAGIDMNPWSISSLAAGLNSFCMLILIKGLWFLLHFGVNIRSIALAY